LAVTGLGSAFFENPMPKLTQLRQHLKLLSMNMLSHEVMSFLLKTKPRQNLGRAQLPDFKATKEQVRLLDDP